MKKIEKEKSIIKNGKQLSLIFLLAVLFVLPANAALQAVGPVGPFGYPTFYQDTNLLALDLCIRNDATGLADNFCVLPASGEEPDFNPALQIAFPAVPPVLNFPNEAFWYLADLGPIPAGTGPGGVKFRLALEAAFASAIPMDGQQIAFLRVNMQPAILGLVPNATYTITYPFGTIIDQADVNGVLIRQRLEDGCFVPGCRIPGADFASFLGAPQTNIGPFLTQLDDPATLVADPMPPGGFLTNPSNPTARYISANPVTPILITNGPNGNFFRIDGPNINPTNFGGTGVNRIEFNQWTLAGRIFQVVNGTIAGTVTNASSGAAIAGATVTADGVSATTDAAGNYTISIAPGTDTMNASAAGFVTQSVPNIIVTSGNTTVQDFALTPTPVAGFTISGRVITRVRGIISGLPGVTMTLTDAAGLVVATNTTDVNGAYSFTGMANASFTVTPTLDGFRFAPPRINVIVDGADVTVRDFRGRAL